VPFFGQTGNERRNNKKQKKRGALSGSDFQVKKGHCKKRSSNIYIIRRARADANAARVAAAAASLDGTGRMMLLLPKCGINKSRMGGDPPLSHGQSVIVVASRSSLVARSDTHARSIQFLTCCRLTTTTHSSSEFSADLQFQTSSPVPPTTSIFQNRFSVSRHRKTRNTPLPLYTLPPPHTHRNRLFCFCARRPSACLPPALACLLLLLSCGAAGASFFEPQM